MIPNRKIILKKKTHSPKLDHILPFKNNTIYKTLKHFASIGATEQTQKLIKGHLVV